jgi:hypothetical protein
MTSVQMTGETTSGLVDPIGSGPRCERCDAVSLLYVLDAEQSQHFTCAACHGIVVLGLAAPAPVQTGTAWVIMEHGHEHGDALAVVIGSDAQAARVADMIRQRGVTFGVDLEAHPLYDFTV